MRLGLTVVEKNIDSFPKVFNVSFGVYIVYVIGTLLTTDACDYNDGASQNFIVQEIGASSAEMGLVTLELSNASKSVTFAVICARIKHKKNL